MNKNLINSHDKLFKALFSNKAAVSEFVAKLFPKDVAERIDTESLALDPTEYVDKELKTHFCDVVYHCVYRGNTDEAIPITLSLLFEHKSTPESHPHFQLLRYLLNIWETQLKQKQALTPVIPIIFYHGRRPWIKKPLEAYFKQTDDVLNRFIPRFDYLLIDTSQYQDEQFQALNVLELQAGMLIMKNIFQTEAMLQKIATIFAELEPLLKTARGRDFFDMLTIYIYSNHNDLTIEMLEENMYNVSPQVKERFVSAAERLEMRGMERGIQQGMQRGIKKGVQQGVQQGIEKGMQQGIEKGIEKIAVSMLKKHYPDADILSLTNLSQQQLEQLKLRNQ